MENLQEEFHNYVKNFESKIYSNIKNFADLAEIFFQNLYPIWDEIKFMTYYETFDGIEEVQNKADFILLKSLDNEIIFEPRKILSHKTNKKKLMLY